MPTHVRCANRRSNFNPTWPENPPAARYVRGTRNRGVRAVPVAARLQSPDSSRNTRGACTPASGIRSRQWLQHQRKRRPVQIRRAQRVADEVAAAARELRSQFAREERHDANHFPARPLSRCLDATVTACHRLRTGVGLAGPHDRCQQHHAALPAQPLPADDLARNAEHAHTLGNVLGNQPWRRRQAFGEKQDLERIGARWLVVPREHRRRNLSGPGTQFGILRADLLRERQIIQPLDIDDRLRCHAPRTRQALAQHQTQPVGTPSFVHAHVTHAVTPITV